MSDDEEKKQQHVKRRPNPDELHHLQTVASRNLLSAIRVAVPRSRTASGGSSWSLLPKEHTVYIIEIEVRAGRRAWGT